MTLSLTRRRLLALALVTLAGGGLVAGGVIAVVWPQLRIKALAPEAAAHRQRILDHLAEGEHPAWAGSYGCSDGYVSHALDISAAGYFYEHSDCLGTPHLSFGEVKVLGPNRVRLEVAEEVADSRLQGGPSALGEGRELISVTWGPERFMVPLGEMTEFCATASGAPGSLPLQFNSFMFLRSADKPPWHDPPDLTGLPQVPAEFARLLVE